MTEKSVLPRNVCYLAVGAAANWPEDIKTREIHIIILIGSGLFPPYSMITHSGVYPLLVVPET